MDKIPVTVIVPLKNEGKNLTACLQMLSAFSEVIVVDSGSTDNTKSIANEFNTLFIDFKWNGKFPKKRNWCLRNLEIKNEWVLFLDADEVLTHEFVNELRMKVQAEGIDGYWVTYTNFFMGRQLRFGDPMKKLPLFKKGCGEYEKIEEDSWSHLDMEVHEHPVVTGNTGVIKSPVIHNDYNGLEHYITKHNAYSTWEARRYLQLRKNGFKGLTKRQKLKYNLLTTGFLPILYFVGAYFFKLGFLDGKAGFYLARFKANYFFQIQTKIMELKKEIHP